MRLLGAKEFLKTVKSGTLCVQYWTEPETCQKIIKDYESHIDITKKYYGEVFVFGDNSGSLTFLRDLSDRDREIVNIDGISYDCLFYYDLNIVGDASPDETLYLVYDTEDEWPEVKVEQSEQVLNKDDLRRIIKWFLETEGDHFRDEVNDENAWALKTLEEDYHNNAIVNYRSNSGK